MYPALHFNRTSEYKQKKDFYMFLLAFGIEGYEPYKFKESANQEKQKMLSAFFVNKECVLCFDS